MKRIVPAPATFRRPVRARLEGTESNRFWNWVGGITAGHLLLFLLLLAVHPFFQNRPAPPLQFISLLPSGALTQGTPGARPIQKPSPQPAPALPQPKPPVPLSSTPLPRPVPPPLPTHTPEQSPLSVPPPAPPLPAVKPAPVQPRIDLTEVERPVSDKAKPKKHHLKPARPAPVSTPSLLQPDGATTAGPDPEQIASELKEKLESAGVTQAIHLGPSGTEHGQPNQFSSFYAALRDQTMNHWEEPQFVDKNAIDPVVQIHVNPDNSVPPERVVLLSSSGDLAYDRSALAAARSLGHLTQPLPDGCPPDISISFTLTH